jgi:hypothetical protein
MPINPNELAIRDDNNTEGMMGQNENIGGIENIRVEDGRLIVINRVWDPEASEWIRMQQPVYDISDLQQATNELYFMDERYEYNSVSLAEYVGQNVLLDATTSGTDWWITKIEYTSTGLPERKRARQGSWDDRAIGWT